MKEAFIQSILCRVKSFGISLSIKLCYNLEVLNVIRGSQDTEPSTVIYQRHGGEGYQRNIHQQSNIFLKSVSIRNHNYKSFNRGTQNPGEEIAPNEAQRRAFRDSCRQIDEDDFFLHWRHDAVIKMSQCLHIIVTITYLH